MTIKLKNVALPTTYKGYTAPGFVENFSQAEWHTAMQEVRRKRFHGGDAAIGLRAVTIAFGDVPCEGGFCHRHKLKRQAAYETNPGEYLFCSDCAIIWATKVEIGCRSNWPN